MHLSSNFSPSATPQSILLIGSQGQVGQELVHTLRSLAPMTAVGRSELDLTHPEAIAQLITTLRPTVIVNAAAYTAVDRAETEPELAHQINAQAPTVMAQAAQQVGATLVHLSTDYVFEGRQGSPYQESDSTNPIGVYGQSKRSGELGIEANCDRAFILRTAWVYGVYGKSNFVKTMLRLGAERSEVRVVADQIGSPTWAREIAGAIAQLLQQHGLTPEQVPYGYYHCTNSGVASWYDFAVAIFEEARAAGETLQVENVIPITTADFPTPAQRPAYSVLAGEKLAGVLGYSATHWRVSLRAMLAAR